MSTSNTNSVGLDPRFKVRSPLRCEGAGRLDCAEDLVSGDRVAIRWLPLDANGEAAADALRKFPSHPVLPAVRSTGKNEHSAYVAMDFPEGRLLSATPTEDLTADQLLEIARDLAEGLQALHAEGLAHGELASDSVLLIQGRRSIIWDTPVVLLDRLTDRRAGERGLAALKRKVSFLAPELARGEVATPSADVYGLAALICLAAGALPPPGANTLAVLHQVASGGWRPAIPESFSESVRSLFERMLSADPLSRPTAGEVVSALSMSTGSFTVPWEATLASLDSVLAPVQSEHQEPILTPAPEASPLLDPNTQPTTVMSMSLLAESVAATQPIDDKSLDALLVSQKPPEGEVLMTSLAFHARAKTERSRLAQLALFAIPVAVVAIVALVWVLNRGASDATPSATADSPASSVEAPAAPVPSGPAQLAEPPTPAATPPAVTPEPKKELPVKTSVAAASVAKPRRPTPRKPAPKAESAPQAVPAAPVTPLDEPTVTQAPVDGTGPAVVEPHAPEAAAELKRPTFE